MNFAAGTSSTASLKVPDKNNTLKFPKCKNFMQELITFVTGAPKHTKVRSADVATAAISILKNSRGTSPAVFDHMNNLFDESVNNYILNLELEGNETLVENVASDENIIQEVQKVFTEFITNDVETWAPLISSWSLSLLGKLGSKYADRRVVPMSPNLQELLQFWNNCRPTRTLIELTRQCLSTLVDSNPDSCIDALIETSVLHSPHFDWVVAHIGSCFPMTVISRVLVCGLKDFISLQDASQDLHLNLCQQTPKLASVVGILGHLANKHKSDMRTAIRSLFNESLLEDATRGQLSTGPFLLHLASMSDVLSDIISSEFVKSITPDTLNMLSYQVERWKEAEVPGIDNLVPVIVLVLLRSNGGSEVIRYLLDIVPPSNIKVYPEVIGAVGYILDSVLSEIQRRVYSNNLEIPFKNYLKTHIAELGNIMFEAEGTKASWMFNIIKLMCINGGEQFTTFVIGHILCSTENFTNYLSSLIQDVQLSQPNALSLTISRQIAELRSERVKQPVTLLRNIINLCEVEQLKRLVIDGIHNCDIEGLADLVSKKEPLYADTIIELLSISITPEQMSVSSLFKVGSSALNYFFHLLSRENVSSVKKIVLVGIVKNLCVTLAKQSAAQNLILRMLVEGAIDENFAKFFGGKVGKSLDLKSSIDNSSLLSENAKATSKLLPPNQCSVFYSGVIGSGLRVLHRAPSLPEDTVLLNRQMILDTLQACCRASWRFPFDDAPNIHPQSLIPGMKIVALLMVELISPDVMFNGLPWPDEEYLKITIERDLRIKQMFEMHPILWDLLFLVASIHPSLCYCSVLLRAIMAVLISYWSSNQDTKTTNSPKQLEMTQTLIHVMAVGQILPPPLSFIDEVLPLISPQEAYILLSDIWQYMKDNVPSPALFSSKDSTSPRVWRNFDSDGNMQYCDKKYTKKLRYVMFENIEKFGSIYAKFFPLKAKA